MRTGRVQEGPGARGSRVETNPLRTRAASTLRAPSRACGFTLLEVILAIVIAVGILVVVLHFYHQAANLRAQLLQEAERVAAVRMVMDRLTADLRAACSPAFSLEGFSGRSASLRFVKTDAPARVARQAARSAGLLPTSDLRRVQYGLAAAAEGTNLVTTGLTRTDQPLVEPRAAPTSAISRATEEGEEPRGPAPLTDAVRFLRFRYWDGTNWRESWNSFQLPRGVEVSLGSEPLPEKTLPEDYPYELYRRVIHLAVGGVAARAGAPASEDTDEEMAPTEESEANP